MTRIALATAMLAFLIALNSSAQDLSKRPSVFFQATAEDAKKIRKILDEEIAIPEELRNKPVPFGDVATHIIKVLESKKLELPMWIDEVSLRSPDGERFNYKEFVIRLEPLKSKITVKQFLDTAMDQLPHKNGAYFIRSNSIEINNRELARVHRLLDHEIGLQFQNANLKEAIEDVGVQINLPIYIDPRCAAEKKTITHQTSAYYTARGLLTSIADMHDWKLIVDEHRVMLMPRTDYMNKLRDAAEEAKLQSDIAKQRGTSRAEKPAPMPEAAP